MKTEIYGIIYKIRNKINNKVYIGQTCQKGGFNKRYPHKGKDIERVYKLHLYNYNKKNKKCCNIQLLKDIERYGFDNFEVKGFRDGAIFAPMIGSIPFVGYVFVMEEGTDIDAFMNDLKENANLSWNICVTAEDMVIDRADDKILFVMCPLSFES